MSAHLRTYDPSRTGWARLIHFPEDALSKYVKSQIPSWDAVDWNEISPALLKVMEMAGQLGIWAVIGCNHRLTKPNLRHNSLFIISDKRKLITRYDKRFCSDCAITDWNSAGRRPQIFVIDGFAMGRALCIGIQFPEVFSEYEQLEADCALFSAFWDDPIFWLQAQGYAAANNLWFSLSIPAQCGGALQGCLIGREGHCLSRCDANTTAHFYRLSSTKNLLNYQSLLPRQGSGVASQEWGESMRLALLLIKKAKTHFVFKGKIMLMNLSLFYRWTAANVLVCKSK